MKGSSNVVSAIQSLRQAYDHMDSFVRDFDGSLGASIFKTYQNKIEWIYKDFLTNRHLTEEVRAGMRKEWESDVFAVPAINEKIALLPPEKRDLVEAMIDAILRGEEIELSEPA